MTPPEQPQTTGPSLGPGDILFVVLRHKWKIIIFALLGLVAAAGIWFTRKPLYESHAKILVRYVTDRKGPLEGTTGGADVRAPEQRGNSLLNTEIEILRSSDSLVAAVQSVGVTRILDRIGGGTNLSNAAYYVQKNLQANAANNSSVIELSMEHRDPQVAQDLLDKIIRTYLRKHLEVHRAINGYEELQQEMESLRQRLVETEEQLKTRKSKAGIIDLAQSKQELAGQISAIRKQIYDTEATLAESRVQLSSFRGEAAAPSTQNTGSTNANAQLPSEADLAMHRNLVQKLATLRTRETELTLTQKLADSSKAVKEVRQQIASTEAELGALGLSATASTLPLSPSPVTSPAGRPFDIALAQANVRALEAKYQILTNQLARVRNEAAEIENAEDTINQLELRKQLAQTQYTAYAKSLEQARLDQALDTTKLNNISVIEEPTLGSVAPNKKRSKIALGAAGGGVGFGLALAFLIDLVLNPTVKRRKEVELGVGVPVIAAFPKVGQNGSHKQLANRAGLPHTPAMIEDESLPWAESDPLLPYYEALRDRVVMSYNGDLHKPKIVGVTSCNPGAGVTRIATGLAAALSKDVQRKVLLLGLERNKVTITAFEKGRPHPDGMHADAPPEIETGTVERNLYSLATTGRNVSGASIVQSFSDLMPKLKQADYDYVIFDLPPICETSGSLRLASQMERTILVVEAEKTHKEKLRSAKKLLNVAQTNLLAVFNKARPTGSRFFSEET